MSDPAHPHLPLKVAEYWVWPFGTPEVTILFTGKGPQRGRSQALHDLTGGRPPRMAWLKQIHSARVQKATEGLCGEGDALITDELDLALTVATADCLPIVVAGKQCLATLHAGWRGLVKGVVSGTVETLAETPRRLRAWIGPSIGPCCYEVGPDVADEVARASGQSVIVAGTVSKPRLDLRLAARMQLARLGVERVQVLSNCTKCGFDRLWSYRHEGPGVGRNWTFAWRCFEGESWDAANAILSGDGEHGG